jgi:phage tail sheath protein FI
MAGMVKHISGGQTYFLNKAPGVYLEEEFHLPRRPMFLTGVPVFLGQARQSKTGKVRQQPHAPLLFTRWSHFHEAFEPEQFPHLAYAVRGFFENGGVRCYVIALEDGSVGSLEAGLEAAAKLNTIDLVCAPDVVQDPLHAFDLQQLIVNHCERAGDRFAILDSRYGDDMHAVGKQWFEIDGKNGAIYYPWVRVRGFQGQQVLVPPCGHVAGMYARTDDASGVHKAPANEVIEGVIDLEQNLTNEEQGYLNSKRINCLRFFPGRGIRVWGARTLSGHRTWMYINVRRFFLTVIRWIDWNMQDVAFEENSPRLWGRIERELNTYFMDQYRRGVLKGDTAQQAFYVKCNADTNSPENRDLGRVVTEIGFAPATPNEFVVVRLIQGASGASVIEDSSIKKNS